MNKAIKDWKESETEDFYILHVLSIFFPIGALMETFYAASETDHALCMSLYIVG